MPSYDFACECGHTFERSYPMSDIKQKAKCPECGKMVRKTPPCPNAICRYSYLERSRGNPRVNRGKGRR